jgi:hypothetical protein
VSRDATGPRASDDLERAGHWTLSAIVLLAVGVSVVMNDGSPLAVENVALVLLGAVYLVLLLAADRRLAALSGPARLVFYGVELTLAASIFFCQARLDSFGMAWLCLMPLLPPSPAYPLPPLVHHGRPPERLDHGSSFAPARVEHRRSRPRTMIWMVRSPETRAEPETLAARPGAMEP